MIKEVSKSYRYIRNIYMTGNKCEKDLQTVRDSFIEQMNISEILD